VTLAPPRDAGGSAAVRQGAKMHAGACQAATGRAVSMYASTFHDK